MFFDLKWRQKKQVEPGTESQIGVKPEIRILTLNEIRSYMLRRANKAIVRARYMEIVTGFSDNIEGKISDDYDDLIEAILTKSGKDLTLDALAMDILEPEPNAQGQQRREKRQKEADELTCDEIIARTWIGIDGDVVMLLPKKRHAIDPALIQLHNVNVDVSVQNWRKVLDTIIQGLGILAGLAGTPRAVSTNR
jgi:hypothetical protein